MPALWQRIAGDLETRIANGDLPPGAEVPSEYELAAEYSAARSTAHRALENLTGRGLLVAVPGRRRQVPQRVQYQINLTRTAGRVGITTAGEQLPTVGADSWLHDVKALGHVPTEDPVKVWRATVNGEDVWVRELLRRIDGRPDNLARWVFPASVAAGTALERGEDIEGGSVPYLARLGYTATRFPFEIWSRQPSPEEAALLKLPGGVTLTVFERTGLRRGGALFREVTLWPGNTRLTGELK